jgi:hypothetical protein
MPITGHQLDHWHIGCMRPASNLDHIEPEPVASVHALDRAGRDAGLNTHDRIASRQDLALRLRRQWNAARDGLRPVLLLRGVPEFKTCAVRAWKGGPWPKRTRFAVGYGSGSINPSQLKSAPEFERIWPQFQ